MSLRAHWRGIAIVAMLAVYAALTVLVLVPDTFLLRFDSWCVDLDLLGNHPNWWAWIHTYVVFGQRGPSTFAFLPFFVWVAWRQRSTRPLVLLATGLLWLNLTVGVVKYAIGRVGPLHQMDVHKLFIWGNSIYPSGHVANAVVLYGLVAWIAPRYRKTLVALAVLLSVTVGLGTVYLRTHWISDVFGGWVAGALVLITLPYLMPYTQRCADWALSGAVRLWRQRQHAPIPTGIPEGSVPVAAGRHRVSHPDETRVADLVAAAASSSGGAETPTRTGD